MSNKSKKEKIAVAMSGGIDSSVSAFLLKKKGYAVAGFYLKLFPDQNSESLKRAKAVAKKIGMPLYVVDARKDFKNSVIENFISEYKNLRTPNPCVLCNKFIKFGLLLKKARSLGYEKIATGHYAIIRKDKKGIFHLLCGADKNKDQSYFLHQLDQNQLSRALFPLGQMKKEAVYSMAKKFKLSFSKKKESQEICFVQDGKYGEFLKKKLSPKHFKSGKIVNSKQEALGIHNGLINYTVGQRRGINQGKYKNENKKPLYVISLDKNKNQLVVGQEKDIYKKLIKMNNVAWISDFAKKKAYESKRLSAKIRYRHEAVSCKLYRKGSKMIVNFQKPQRAIAPGQYAAIYYGQEVLGGGKILK